MDLRYLYCLILLLIFHSCEKTDVKSENDDSFIYISYDPPEVIALGDSLLLDVNNDTVADIMLISIHQELDRYTYISNESVAIHDSITMSFGTQFGSVFTFIEMGDTLNEGTVQWNQLIPLSGRSFSGKSGVWGGNGKCEGYIGIKLIEQHKPKFGWLKLGTTDTSLTLNEYAFKKDEIPPAIIVGNIP